MFCKYLKLTNGDNLIVTTDDDCQTLKGKEFLICADPVQVGTLRVPRGSMIIESIVLQPWIKISVDNVIKIPVTSILVAVDVHEIAYNQYKNFVEEYENYNFEISEDMESNDYREKFQDFLDNIMGQDNEEDEDDRIRRTDRTYH